VDVSMTEAVFAHNIVPLAVTNTIGRPAAPGRDMLTGGLPCYNVYRTLDNRLMAVGALELKFWEVLCDVIQRPELKAKHWTSGQIIGGSEAMTIKSELDMLFATQTQAAWTEKFKDADCCVTPILRIDEALKHPLFESRNMVKNASHDTEGDYWQVAAVPKFSA